MNQNDPNPPVIEGGGTTSEDTSKSPLHGPITTHNTRVITDVESDELSPHTSTETDIQDLNVDKISDTPLEPSIVDEESISGSAPATTSDDDTSEAISEVTGSEPIQGEPYSIADDINENELSRHGSLKEEDRVPPR